MVRVKIKDKRVSELQYIIINLIKIIFRILIKWQIVYLYFIQIIYHLNNDKVSNNKLML